MKGNNFVFVILGIFLIIGGVRFISGGHIFGPDKPIPGEVNLIWMGMGILMIVMGVVAIYSGIKKPW